MTRPPQEEAKEMKCRKLVKEIWEKELKRNNDELALFSFGKNFMTINKKIDIPISFFEDYFVANGEEKTICRKRIKKRLEQLL